MQAARDAWVEVGSKSTGAVVDQRRALGLTSPFFRLGHRVAQ